MKLGAVIGNWFNSSVLKSNRSLEAEAAVISFTSNLVAVHFFRIGAYAGRNCHQNGQRAHYPPKSRCLEALKL
jgi:hypothetical protein